MPFDAMPESVVSDLVRLRIARDGVKDAWTSHRLNMAGASHCVVGWLLQATEGDKEAAVQLAMNYVYPVLPQSAKKDGSPAITAIMRYNDGGGHKRVLALMDNAVKLAEQT